jgi:hypothetical protein
MMKCRYAECHYAECGYAECGYAECHHAECLGTFTQALFNAFSLVKTQFMVTVIVIR